MMLVTSVSLLVVFLCGLLHFVQHYRCRCCLKSKYRHSLILKTHDLGHSRSRAVIARKQLSVTTTTNGSPSKRHQRSSLSLLDTRLITSMSSFRDSLQFAFSGQQRQCRCCIFGVERDFDFFPSAFLCYQILLILVLSLVMARSLLFHHSIDVLFATDNSHEVGVQFAEFTELLQYQLRQEWSSWSSRSRFVVSQNQSGGGDSGYVLDWILAHCVLILAVWESCFNFYRFFSTWWAAKYFCSVETSTIFCRFSIYVLLFGLLSMLNLYCYFWLFPLTVAVHLVFNLFCAWRFAHILVEQYQHLIS